VVPTNSTGAYDMTNTNGFVAPGTANTGNLAASGSGIRLMWYPSRYAFRAGSVNGSQWNSGSIGYGSVALGSNTTASGDNSFAVGNGATASADEAMALGNGSSATGAQSFAVSGTASGQAAFALGSGAQATNDNATAIGPSAIAGGLAATVIGPSVANGNFGVAIGLQNSASGNFSVAIGKNARTANRQGSVVIGDGCAGFSSDSVYPSANNQFVVRGCGGIKLYTNQGLTSGVEIAAGGGSWSSISDRNRKENFLTVDGEDLLARLRQVPVSTWNYKSQDQSIRHMGPMAQDLYAAFGLGESDKLINTVDIDGVNMAGVQALERRTAAQAEEIRTLRSENERLHASARAQDQRIEDLEARLRRLEALLPAASVQR
jgi:hypothetical protein